MNFLSSSPNIRIRLGLSILPFPILRHTPLSDAFLQVTPSPSPSPSLICSLRSHLLAEQTDREHEPAVDPLAPLSLQPYFHGRISRTDAESLVTDDGDFLVGESTNSQYVLTGRSGGKPEHLLLMDKNGRVSMSLLITANELTVVPLQVKYHGREFESVPHLVKFFANNAIPLIINSKEVFLSTPIPRP